MSELEWNLESAELAYDTIARYVEHTQISALLIAYLANALGEERLKTLVQGEQWQLYQASRRQLIEAREGIDRLTAVVDDMRKSERGE